MSTSPRRAFGDFELHGVPPRLRRAGVVLPLRQRAVEVLAALLEQPGQVVAKRSLCERVWPGLADAENNLHVEISALRKQLGPGWIVTVPGQGYQFAGQQRAWIDDMPAVAGDRQACPPPLAGRVAELAALRGALRPGAWITLVGEGGIGKTRVAEAVAAAWDGPVAVLRLEGLGEPAAEARLRAQASPRTALLVLDACEGLAETLLRCAPPARTVLATSREVLQLPGERVWPLGPLPWVAAAGAEESDAALLLRSLLAYAGAAIPPTQAAAVALRSLAEVLEGHPLACLAAAFELARRAGKEDPDAVLVRLARTGPDLDAPTAPATRRGDRHASLRSVYDACRSRLAPADQLLLGRLARLPQPFDLADAAAAACPPPAESRPNLARAPAPWGVVDALGRLADAAWLTAELEGPVGRVRYRLGAVARRYLTGTG